MLPGMKDISQQLHMTLLELWIGRLAAVAGFATLGVALYGICRATLRPVGLETGAARRILRWPFILFATVLYFGLGALLWRPLQLKLSPDLQLIATVVGASIYFPSLALYLWSYITLGEMFGGSSGFGVRLNADHRLTTSGPFSVIRHPMYLAVIFSFFGAFLIYRTWTLAIYAFSMLGLVVRARREESALSIQFGEAWEEYRQRVPGWFPWFRRRKGDSFQKGK
jgi:protein-S-isoprenylcysteine O-methyltransferase Ste14